MATNKTFGYARVSSKDQNEDRQVTALSEYVNERDIYIDKASGKDFERPAYQNMKSRLRDGDTVVVLSLDRLGRNYDQIREEWQWFAENNVHIKIIDMPILNTDGDDLNQKLIADITLTLLSYVADKERENIKSRQAQGIEAAKGRGVKFGRPRIEPDNWDAVYADWKAGKLKGVEAQKLLNMKPGVFYKRVREIEGRA